MTVNLNGPPAKAGGDFTIGAEIQPAFADEAFDYARRLAPKLHVALLRESLVIAAAHNASYAGHGAQEILDHPVGIGMTNVEAIEFAIGRQVDARLPLDIEDDPRRVRPRLLAGKRGQPVWNRIRANCRRQYGWPGHQYFFSQTLRTNTSPVLSTSIPILPLARARDFSLSMVTEMR